MPCLFYLSHHSSIWNGRETQVSPFFSHLEPYPFNHFPFHQWNQSQKNFLSFSNFVLHGCNAFCTAKNNFSFCVLLLHVLFRTSFKVSFKEPNLDIPVFLRMLMASTIPGKVKFWKMDKKKIWSCREDHSSVSLFAAIENRALRQIATSKFYRCHN